MKNFSRTQIAARAMNEIRRRLSDYGLLSQQPMSLRWCVNLGNSHMTSGTIQHVQLIAYGVFAMLNAAAISSHAAGTETTDRSAAVQAVSESKDRRMNDTATKIAEFKDSFVVGGLDFNGDGTQLATSGMVAGPEAHVWTWRASGQGARVLPMNSPAGGGEAIRYSVDGTFLAVGHKHDLSGSGVIRVWNTKNWEAREVVDTGLATEFMGLEFSPDGKFLARTVDRAGRPGSTLVLNKIESGAEVWGFDAHPFFARTLALSPTGQFVALGGHTSALGPQGPLSFIIRRFSSLIFHVG